MGDCSGLVCLCDLHLASESCPLPLSRPSQRGKEKKKCEREREERKKKARSLFLPLFSRFLGCPESDEQEIEDECSRAKLKKAREINTFRTGACRQLAHSIARRERYCLGSNIQKKQ